MTSMLYDYDLVNVSSANMELFIRMYFCIIFGYISFSISKLYDMSLDLLRLFFKHIVSNMPVPQWLNLPITLMLEMITAA